MSGEQHINTITPDSQGWLESALHHVIDPITSGLADHWHNFLQYIQEEVQKVMHELINWILQTPMIGHDPITMKVWHIIQVIAFSLIGLIWMYEGFKRVSAGEPSIGQSIELKQLLMKSVFAVMLSIFSLEIVNIFIGLNNAFVQTLAANFPLQTMADTTIKGVENGLVTIAIFIAQLVIALRLIIHYWIRQAKVYLLAVMAPLVYILGIRQPTNRVSTWLADLTTTIFTQAIHALILAMYGMLLALASAQGTISSVLLSVAMLLLMLEAPPILKQYVGAGSGGIANPIRTLKTWGKNGKNIALTPKQAGAKVLGWFMKK